MIAYRTEFASFLCIAHVGTLEISEKNVRWMKENGELLKFRDINYSTYEYHQSFFQPKFTFTAVSPTPPSRSPC